MAKRLSSTELSSARNWCSDNLHELLGFADSALAGFLVDVASSSGSKKKKSHDGSNVKRVMKTLHEGGVTADEGRLLNFAQELCRRCSGGGGNASGSSSVGAASSAAAASNRQLTNADMMKKAANYSLMDMDEPELKLPDKPKKKDLSGVNDNNSVPGTIVTKSSRGSDKTKTIRRPKEDDRDSKRSKDGRESSKKEDRRKRRRRRHSSSSSSSSGDDNAVIDEERIREERERRREEIRQKRSKKDKRGDNEDNDHDLSKLTPEERAEIERERDIRERDEFAKRLNQKDKRKQRSKLDAVSLNISNGVVMRRRLVWISTTELNSGEG